MIEQACDEARQSKDNAQKSVDKALQAYRATKQIWYKTFIKEVTP